MLRPINKLPVETGSL